MPNTAPGSALPTRVLVVLALPMLLVAVGAWEVARGASTVAEYRQEHVRLAAQLGRVQTLARRNPEAVVTFQGEQQSFGAPAAAQMMAEGDDQLRTNLLVARLRAPFGWLAAAAGALSLAGGLLGLLLVAAAARRGMRSRDALVKAFGQVRRLLPLALGCQVAGVALALLGVVGFECGGLWFTETVSAGEVKLVALGLIAAGAALWGAFVSIRQLRRAFGLFEPDPAGLVGTIVTQTEAPGLFALVGDLAKARGAPVPQTVVAGAVSGFFVTSYPQRLQTTGQVIDGRTLHVCLPQLVVLNRAELRVVLAHELAHFSGEDTAYSMQFQPVYVGLQHAMAAVAGRPASRNPPLDRMLRPAHALGQHVLDRFDRAVKHWSRLREFEADRAAIATEPPEALATSLLRTAVASEIVDAQLDALNRRPADAPADLMGQTLEIAGRQGLIEPARHLQDRQPHPTDTHPPTAQRIAAAGVTVDDGMLARAARPVLPGELAAAEALFSDWPGLCASVTAQLRSLAEQREQAYLRRVEAAAAGVADGTVEVHERRAYIVTVLGAAAACCFALAGFVFWLLWTSTPAPGEDPDTVLWAVVAVSALCGFAACLGVLRFASSRAPFLVLNADGFTSPAFVGAVRWSALSGIAVAGGRGVTTVLTLAPNHALPDRTGRIWRFRTRRRRHALVFAGLTPAGMKTRAYLDLLARHHRAALARAELARRGRAGAADQSP